MTAALCFPRELGPGSLLLGFLSRLALIPTGSVLQSRGLFVAPLFLLLIRRSGASVTRENEAWEALKAEIADMFRPLLRNLSEICSLRRAYDLEDYQIGMLFGTILIMVMKDIKKNYVRLDVIRMPVLLLYICAFLFDVAGMKKYGRRTLISLVNLLKTRGGIQEIYRIMRYPGYISPYDDSADWLQDSS